ncbi:ArsR family transcriptional regulator [Halobacteriales archaeon QS_6_71_20]|nr:MAG: ArsR family transcriptional regulator [Halobacteriales archaeon QS_6_71_20]
MVEIPSAIPGVGGPDSDAVDDRDADPRVIGVDGDDADAVLSALSSDTAREILSALHERPGPASDVAERVDSSLQNTQYHLNRLREAGVVEVADTVYSQKGREMDVYAPADGPLVLVAGDESETAGVRATLRRLLGGVGAVGLGALLVEEPESADTAATATEAAADGAAATPTPTPSDGDMGVAEATATPTPTAEPAATEAGRETVSAVAAGDPTLLDQLVASPGFLFLCGGLLALALATLYARRRGAI